jgi:uncharacterized protein
MKSPTPFERKLNRVRNILKKLEKIVVAFSGGVDSSLLLMLSLKTLGKENVLAVTVSSPTFPEEELKEAARLAKSLGAKWLKISSQEFKNPLFRKNTPYRCYYCKKELFAQLKELGEKEGFKYLIEGSNTDDLKDYRPGLKALKELGVKSPLAQAGLTKEEIRKAAREFNLPNWQKPSSACLASRFPYYQPLTLKELKKVAQAEKFLKKLGFSQVRVRHHKETARIEAGEAETVRLLQDPELRKKVSRYLKNLGYTFVALDLDGYQAGSLNKLLKRKASSSANP